MISRQAISIGAKHLVPSCDVDTTWHVHRLKRLGNAEMSSLPAISRAWINGSTWAPARQRNIEVMWEYAIRHGLDVLVAGHQEGMALLRALKVRRSMSRLSVRGWALVLLFPMFWVAWILPEKLPAGGRHVE